jgi:hypothetical protein
MSIFTSHELEFLASLRRDWRRLYWNELARLLKDDDHLCDARQPSPQIARGFSYASEFSPPGRSKAT